MPKPDHALLNPVDIRRDGMRWKRLDRGEALRAWRVQPVVVISRNQSRETAAWFDSGSRYYRVDGPYDFSGLAYYAYLGGGKEKRSAGRLQPKPEPEVFEPLEAINELTGEAMSLGSPEKKVPDKKKFPIEFKLVTGGGDPLGPTDYQLTLPDGQVLTGTSDQDGFVRVPDNKQSGEVKLVLVPAEA